ncbi:MAG: hypothetical protein R3F39_09655 [Myxococcota bacterium]
MLKTVRAIIDGQGRVRLLEPVQLMGQRQALVTILEADTDLPAGDPSDAALLSEQALAADWDRPEEDAAWAHLQPDP